MAAFAMLLLQARQVDRWDTEGKLGILVVILLLGAAITCLRAILFSQSRRFKTVEAESFVLKEGADTLARLERAGNFGGSLSFYDVRGIPVMNLGATETPLEATLVLRDMEGKQRVRLAVDGGALPCVEVFDEDGTKRVELGVSERSVAHMTLFSGVGNRPAISLTAHDQASSLLLTAKNKLRLTLRADTDRDTEVIRIFDPNEKPMWSAP
jgi:hypothetical protein